MELDHSHWFEDYVLSTASGNETDLSRRFDNLRLPSSVIDKGSYRLSCINTSVDSNVRHQVKCKRQEKWNKL